MGRAGPTDADLHRVRDRIRQIDRDVVRLAAERLALAREVGEVKRGLGLPIRNYTVEAEAIRLAREECAAVGIPPTLGEDLVKLLISEALHVQERDRARRSRETARNGGRALVIGGRGNMGAWFAEFLDSKGFAVATADLRGPLDDYPHVEDYASAAEGFDLVCVATPPSTVGDVLSRLDGRTEALVFEIASLKTPFLKTLEALAARGMNVTSVHPMWGPRTELLASKNVVICDCGRSDATRAAKALFEDTAANVVEIPVAEHDAFMAYTLGLPHALNLAFSHALATSAPAFAGLRNLGGPTFTKQSRVAREVAGENKDLYYEIQRFNAHTPEVYASIRSALDALEASLGERDAFRDLMKLCQDYYGSEVGP